VRGHVRVGVTGFSMGGQMAAMIAASAPFPLAVAALAPSCTPAAVFVQGYLRHAVDVAALGGPGARELLDRRLRRFDVRALPPPPAGSSAIVVGARRDGIVPPSEPEAIARHWGAELRWLDAGHVSTVLFHQDALRRAVRDAVDGLRQRSVRAA
jgi:dienelactone hydrolase